MDFLAVGFEALGEAGLEVSAQGGRIKKRHERHEDMGQEAGEWETVSWSYPLESWTQTGFFFFFFWM